MPRRFEAFRALASETKARVVAFSLAEAVRPFDLQHGEALLRHVEASAVPNLRAVWRPTGEAFFGRLRKSVLLRLLATDLRQPEEAARLASGPKQPVVDHLERLFAAPFATLTPEQREAVEAWCPPGMTSAPDGAPRAAREDGRAEDGHAADAPRGEDALVDDGGPLDVAEAALVEAPAEAAPA